LAFYIGGEVGALPQTPVKKLFKKSFLTIFKKLIPIEDDIHNILLPSSLEFQEPFF
jgi:hypothetical protein